MTTVRLTPSQKLKVRKASEILRSIVGRNVTQGETVAALADFALRHRELLADMASEATVHREDDPFFDLSLTFDLGKTDERTHDRVLYGRP